MDHRWRGWDNAEIYDRFLREHRIYGWLNERLVDAASLDGARRILDLGCGTGATTRECLRRLPADAEVVGIDSSEEMIAVAEAHIFDPRAVFVVGDARQADQLVEGPFDRALSNAAFWQFPDTERVLGALARLLAPGGLFAFNVPAERIEGAEAPFHPFQVALAVAVAEVSGEPFVRTSTEVDLASIAAAALPLGLELERSERLVYEGKQLELMDLMEIPAMIEPLTVGLDAIQTRQVLDRARGAVDPDERVSVAWMFVRLRRR